MKLVQLNVERDRHIDRWLSFLQNEQPDIVCLQEVMEPTFERVHSELGLQGTDVPMARLQDYEEGTDGVPWGIALLTHHPYTTLGAERYDSFPDELPVHTKGDNARYGDCPMHRPLLIADVSGILVGSTHFTWTPHGVSTEPQRHACERMCALLDKHPELVLCGDFNIPRQTNELYHRLAERYTNNVPGTITSTLDPSLHRKPDLRLVVDYVWSTPGYRVTNLRVIDGLSDHCALVCDVERIMHD